MKKCSKGHNVYRVLEPGSGRVLGEWCPCDGPLAKVGT